MTLDKSALDGYTYLDLEVDGHDQIFSYGLLSPRYELKLGPDQAESIYAPLLALDLSTDLLCGHNIRRFDWFHLVKQWPDLESHPVAHALIDTLELSVLAFALAPSHKLGKHYKLSDYASNDPLEDARATRLLVEECLSQLDQQPAPLRQFCLWLITQGNTAADDAYRQLFSALGWLPDQPTALTDLPTAALAGTAWARLADLPSLETLGADFDHRLTLAALLVWNFKRHSHRSESGDAALKYSIWLEHLPPFPRVRDTLFPLLSQGFTYQPFLAEFGLDEFQSIQEKAVQAIVAGKNPLILMPTGGGKSLCYQLPALMHYRCRWGLTVCISPLQALMEDQVADLEAKGLDFATFINGNLPAELRNERLRDLRNGRKGLLYISPEQLRSLSISTLLRDRLPALWVMDEAHCISQWGQDFRPDYRYIPKFIRELYADQGRPLPALALLTATATAQVRQDIRHIFGQQQIPIKQEDIAASLQRHNLNFQVIPVSGHKEPLIVEAIQQATHQGGCALVYTTTRARAKHLAERLTQQGMIADHYHGKIPKDKKAEVLKAFKAGELNVVTATCAFGMGINRKDVRLVIHDTPSGSLESYLQEAGRAGRDDEPADCTLLFDPSDVDMLFRLKSLGQLSEIDLRNIFETLRGLQKRANPGTASPKDAWFWVTADEIYQTSTLDERFANDDNQRETKIRVALHHLEDFGLIERAENRSTVVQFSLKKPTPRQSWQTFQAYSRNLDLKTGEIQQFKRLIYAVHLIEHHRQQEGGRLSLERLSDESGISIPDLPGRIRELQRAGVCTSNLPLTLLITKGVRGDAKNAYERHCSQERELLTYLAEKIGDKGNYVFNPRRLATLLDPQNNQKLRSSHILNILTGWQSLGWISLRRRGGDLLDIKAPRSMSEMAKNSEDQAEIGPLSQVIEWLPRHQTLCERLIYSLYNKIDEKLDGKTGGASCPPM